MAGIASDGDDTEIAITISGNQTNVFAGLCWVPRQIPCQQQELEENKNLVPVSLKVVKLLCFTAINNMNKSS